MYLSHEKNNHFDSFAIKMFNTRGNIVGHLPMEISLITKFLLDRDARIKATLRSTHYRRSPLVLGGLEIPWTVKVSMMPPLESRIIGGVEIIGGFGRSWKNSVVGFLVLIC